MAILKPGALGTASGSIGAITLAPGRGSTTVRSRGIAPNRTSTQALTARANLSHTAAAWRDPANADVRRMWITFALATPVPNRFGTPRLLSGFNWWMRYNSIMPFLDWQPPVTPAHDWHYVVQINSITFDSTPTFTVDYLTPLKPHQPISIVFISRFASAATTNSRPIWRRIFCDYANSTTMDYSPTLTALNLIPITGESWLIWLSLADRFHLPSPPFLQLVTCP